LQVGCAAAKEAVSPLTKLGQVLREKAKGDFARVFKGTAKTRERLSVVEELLTYWNIDEADDQLEELEEALICADFGPKTALKVVDALREDILAGAPLRGLTVDSMAALRMLTQRLLACGCTLPGCKGVAPPCLLLPKRTHAAHSASESDVTTFVCRQAEDGRRPARRAAGEHRRDAHLPRR
jgi:SRP54-type protein, helical bundle domain